MRFLDAECAHPTSTSDYLAFCTSIFLKKLMTPNFLCRGLTLFGDNAYVNNSFMTSPFKAVTSIGLKDAFNYYHSQLRINIKCAFDVLVHRWGCLRKPIPANFSVRKICALLRCLCFLHNFGIIERLIRNKLMKNQAAMECEPIPRRDLNKIIINGGTVNLRLDSQMNNFNNTTDSKN